ncbi:MAG: hypothetical protein DHS20C17_03360 [Cyclobacteriaceae bacterium]|nr:MAG: hypothetical protein DHS20C17_03360 [Cyclobacteriaceae bacterium]
MKSEAKTVEDYLRQIPEKRVSALKKLRNLCLKYLPDHEESMVYKMPSYIRNDQVEVAFASQQQHISVYILKHEVMLNNKARLKGLNHGKGCIRYSNPDKIDYELITDLLKQTVDSDAPIC